MNQNYKHPSPQSVPVDEGHPRSFPAPAEVGPPSPQFDDDYLDGNLAGYEGANPGRDQDRNRQCECIPAHFNYPAGATGSDPSQTDTDGGF
jgi:hypothetical protein